MLTLLLIVLGIFIVLVGGIIILIGIGPIIVIGGFILKLLFKPIFALFIIGMVVIRNIVKKNNRHK